MDFNFLSLKHSSLRYPLKCRILRRSTGTCPSSRHIHHGYPGVCSLSANAEGVVMKQAYLPNVVKSGGHGFQVLHLILQGAAPPPHPPWNWHDKEHPSWTYISLEDVAVSDEWWDRHKVDMPIQYVYIFVFYLHIQLIKRETKETLLKCPCFVCFFWVFLLGFPVNRFGWTDVEIFGASPRTTSSSSCWLETQAGNSCPESHCPEPKCVFLLMYVWCMFFMFIWYPYIYIYM